MIFFSNRIYAWDAGIFFFFSMESSVALVKNLQSSIPRLILRILYLWIVILSNRKGCFLKDCHNYCFIHSSEILENKQKWNNTKGIDKNFYLGRFCTFFSIFA